MDASSKQVVPQLKSCQAPGSPIIQLHSAVAASELLDEHGLGRNVLAKQTMLSYLQGQNL